MSAAVLLYITLTAPKQPTPRRKRLKYPFPFQVDVNIQNGTQKDNMLWLTELCVSDPILQQY